MCLGRRGVENTSVSVSVSARVWTVLRIRQSLRFDGLSRPVLLHGASYVTVWSLIANK